jgi:hypothetical protein
MWNGWVTGDAVAMAVVAACGWLVFQRMTSDRWQRRFGSIGSPLIASPAYRALFVLVVIGMLLIALLPEAAFVFPAIDAVGLDIVTIFAALELRHYVGSVARRVGIPSGVGHSVRAWAQAMCRRAGGLLTNPALVLYACMWALIWVRMLTGTMKVTPPTQL